MAKFLASLLVISSLAFAGFAVLRPELLKPYLFPSPPIDTLEYSRYVANLPLVLAEGDGKDSTTVELLASQVSLGQQGAKTWVLADGFPSILQCDLVGCGFASKKAAYASRDLFALIKNALKNQLKSDAASSCRNLVLAIQADVPFKYIRDVFKLLPTKNCSPKLVSLSSQELGRWPSIPLGLSEPSAEIMKSKLPEAQKLRKMLLEFKKEKAFSCQFNRRLLALFQNKDLKQNLVDLDLLLDSKTFKTDLRVCSLSTYEQQYLTRLAVYGTKQKGRGLKYKSLKLKQSKVPQEKPASWEEVLKELAASTASELKVDI